MFLRKQSSTDRPFSFFMADSADHVTGKTGLTPTVTLSKDGAAFGAASGVVTELASGWYALAGHATDRGTLGELLVHATAAGADPFDGKLVVVPWDPFDVASLGLTNLDATVGSRATPTNVDDAEAAILADLAARVDVDTSTLATAIGLTGARDSIQADLVPIAADAATAASEAALAKTAAAAAETAAEQAVTDLAAVQVDTTRIRNMTAGNRKIDTASKRELFYKDGEPSTVEETFTLHDSAGNLSVAEVAERRKV